MTLFEGLILGFIQGLTEFLPVSSSGHLVIGQTVLGISNSGVLFEVAVHVATLASVLVVYRDRVGRLVIGALRGDRGAWRYVGLLVLATIPAAAVGLLFGSRVEALFESPVTVGFALLVTGSVLWSTRWARPTIDAAAPASDAWSRGPNVGAALVMGFAQAFALVPGISRSGSTVAAALWVGVEVREAAAFSFLMAIPAISGAAVLQLPEVSAGQLGPGLAALVAGGLMAGVIGIAAIRIFVAMLRGGSFHRFGVYCWLAGGAFLLYLVLR